MAAASRDTLLSQRGHEPLLWQRNVPVEGTRRLTKTSGVLLAFGVLGVLVASVRMTRGLGFFSGMNDSYAWGVWKTFNVMTLTALGSSGLAVGLAAWVLGRHRLHVVMRTALITSFLLYAAGLALLAVDVGRPWNFWNLLRPWKWNGHSPLFEVALAMPLYCAVFLSFELLPTIAERLWYRGSPGTRRMIRAVRPPLRKIYPWAIAGAYLIPLGHQSSLGALMLLAGQKLDPLWQTPTLPLLYLLQALQGGLAFTGFILMAACLVWKRPLDMAVLGELAELSSKTSFVWLAIRFVDLVVRRQLGHTLGLDGLHLVFWAENLLVLLPAIAFRTERVLGSPRSMFRWFFVACLGGMLYRFAPTTLSFRPDRAAQYFPSLPEFVISVGLTSLGLGVFALACKTLAILPAPMSTWRASMERLRAETPSVRRDVHGNPIDD